MLMQAVLMVCAMGAADCTETTALKVVTGPTVSSEALCTFQAEVLRAQNARGDGTMVKKQCVMTSLVTVRNELQSPLAQATADALLN
jgi:hypothetical protein